MNVTGNRAVSQRSDLLFIAASFWFEESPCAVRTNTASLDRLCTLFVLSTLLDFEHIHAFLIEYACSMLHNGNDAMEHVGVIIGMPTQIA